MAAEREGSSGGSGESSSQQSETSDEKQEKKEEKNWEIHLQRAVRECLVVAAVMSGGKPLRIYCQSSRYSHSVMLGVL